MKRFWQRTASSAIRLVQKHGPTKVRVLGQTYVVSRDVFNPKFYLTSEFMAENIRVKPDDEILDMGTGSGILAVTAAKSAGRVFAVDISAQAVCCARENAARNGVAGSVSVLQGDLFAPLPRGVLFDVILFNPPYLEGKPRGILDLALYDPGKSLMKRFLEGAKDYLKSKGYVQMLYTTIARPERVLAMAADLGWKSAMVAKKRGLFETFVIWKLTVKNSQESRCA